MNSELTTNIEHFFKNPSIPRPPRGEFSQLYLLRRDISICFGIDPDTGQPHCGQTALWPGVMAVCAGIDLLGKFFAGSDANRGVGKRFRAFLTAFFQISEADAKIIYQLRNSLLHSFGLYSEERDKAGNLLKTYKFILDRGRSTLITNEDSDTYRISIDILRTRFEEAIMAYAARVKSDSALQVNFTNMLPKHFGVWIA